MWEKIGGFVLSLLCTGFFAGSETALTITMSDEKTCRGLITGKSPKQEWLVYCQEQFNFVLTILLLGNNLCVIGASVLASSFAWNLHLQYRNFIGQTALYTVPVITAVLVLYLGEIIPKIYAKTHSEMITRFSLPLLYHLTVWLKPVLNFFTWIADFIIHPVLHKLKTEMPFPTIEELRGLLYSPEVKQALRSDEWLMMDKILDFGQLTVTKVMIPRVRMFTVNLKEDRQEVVNKIIKSGFSRVPVYVDNFDNIIGLVFAKDLLKVWRNKVLFTFEDLLRPVFFVPETKKISELLVEFKKGHQHLAVVVDEYGGTVGLVTIEDLVEQIVGEIYDEYDLHDSTISPLPDGSYIISADTKIDRLNTELAWDLPEREFSTVSGWVLDIFGRVPKIGETRTWGDLKIEIIESTRRRVTKIKLQRVNKNIPTK